MSSSSSSRSSSSSKPSSTPPTTLYPLCSGSGRGSCSGLSFSSCGYSYAPYSGAYYQCRWNNARRTCQEGSLCEEGTIATTSQATTTTVTTQATTSAATTQATTTNIPSSTLYPICSGSERGLCSGLSRSFCPGSYSLDAGAYYQCEWNNLRRYCQTGSRCQ
jgi:hypothetical protein